MSKTPKPTLIQIGDSFVDPSDVAAIVKAGSKKGLFIVRLKSQPNAEFPLWVHEKDLTALMGAFNIVEAP